jgi:di/tricarboxylate transporter
LGGNLSKRYFTRPVKAGLGAQVSKSITESMRLPDRSRGSAGLSLAAMIFYGYTGAFLLTGSYVNIMAMGLMQNVSTSWLSWFYYALPAEILFAAAMFIAIWYFFKPDTAVQPPSPEVLDQQLATLGSLTREERVTIAVMAGVIIMVITQPWHHIDNSWIALAGFATLLLGGVLNEQILKSDINWRFFLFMGDCVQLRRIVQAARGQ